MTSNIWARVARMDMSSPLLQYEPMRRLILPFIILTCAAIGYGYYRWEVARIERAEAEAEVETLT